MNEARVNEYGEATCVAFVIFCDENDLTRAEGLEFARKLGESLLFAAESRDYAR